MNWAILITLLTQLGLWLYAPIATAATPTQADITLTNGWHVTQDVSDLGEVNKWYDPQLEADWQPIDRLVHLQLLLAAQPYFGRELRYFNDAPWWYRLEFSTSEVSNGATLWFGGVDYFSKVWLNGVFLGGHEGYADSFEFEVARLLRKDRPNVLVVKVSSPWDHEYADPTNPIPFVVRNLQKGSYEHADGFVQRDVNPVGIWRPVKLRFHGDLRETETPSITASLPDGGKRAFIHTVWPVFNEGQPTSVDYIVHIRTADTKEEVATDLHVVKLEHGATVLSATTELRTPRLWNTWDRGSQPLYRAELEVAQSHNTKLISSTTFGIRTVELHRTKDETRFFINGKSVYLRGTAYWPDLYLSNMSKSRYERDVQAAIRAGINAFRVHVHTENSEFYEICDRLGIVVIQDNDLNWMFPKSHEFTTRAALHFETLISLLRNHPSVIAWIAMNEAYWGAEGGPTTFKKDDVKAIGAKLVETAYRVDPTRPVIENSGMSGDLASGDTHDYRGSLIGADSTYFDIYRSLPPDFYHGSSAGTMRGESRLVTEFGVDAPPVPEDLRTIPEAAQRLRNVLPRISELHDYQYHLLKYYIEYYRTHKYSPNAGYFQFMWIDFSPQSFYGIYDYWGNAKAEGLGGGLQALLESNQPVGIFLEHDDRPHALHAVNDSSSDLGNCLARWRVSSSKGVVEEGSQAVRLGPDSHQRIRNFKFEVRDGDAYTVTLDLLGADGKVLAHNSYVNPFQPQPRPQGYPDRMDDELGMRLWWASGQ
jgi:beta-mannosidase